MNAGSLFPEAHSAMRRGMWARMAEVFCGEWEGPVGKAGLDP